MAAHQGSVGVVLEFSLVGFGFHDKKNQHVGFGGVGTLISQS